MAQWTQYRQAFYREVVQHGITRGTQFNTVFPLGTEVPQRRLEIWLRKFHKSNPITKWPEHPKLVNRFKLGADPEFVFAYDGAERMNADQLGLKQGPAFGADNNGRLAEIRPWPSRSALHVTASILDTLRWLMMTEPKVQTLHWLTGAYVFQDGIGGHVHFGRKRPTRTAEVRALDNLCEWLIQLGSYPREEIRRRREGDRLGQRYGLPGDFRVQKHGYEYRTFPSWLDSPQLTFLTLVLSKLAVHCPELVTPFITGESCEAKLGNLLAYYRDMDDDARLAYEMLRKGQLPRHVGGDFRQRWGLMDYVQKPRYDADGQIVRPQPLKREVEYIPSSIAPSKVAVREVFELLLNNQRLAATKIEPTWGPTKVPREFQLLLDKVTTTQAKGLGELICGLVGFKGVPVQIMHAGRGHYGMLVPTVLKGLLPVKDGVLDGVPVQWNPDMKVNIHIGQEYRENPALAKKVKQVLLKYFPVWEIGTADLKQAEEWRAKLLRLQERVPAGQRKTRFIGKVLYQTRSVSEYIGAV